VYARSKVASEAVARELQDRDAPVVVVQPGAVLGPGDPHQGDSTRRLRDVLRGRYPMWPTGGIHVVDVRDVARVHAAVMKPGAGPRRYLVPGHFVDGRTMFTTLHAVTGRRLPHVVMPATMMLPVAWAASAAQRVLPFHLPVDYEAVLVAGYGTRCDDSRARTELGIQPHSLEQTYSDTVRWLHHIGRLTARQAGRAIDEGPPSL
jgi:nucleoside-diphosphate-sugar epimerase